MLNVLRPTGQLGWNDLPATLIPLSIEGGVDLGRVLRWEPADRKLDATMLALAVRYGVASTEGIVADAKWLWQHTHAATLRQSYVDTTAARAGLKDQDALMERVAPGWIIQGKMLDKRIAASEDVGSPANRTPGSHGSVGNNQ